MPAIDHRQRTYGFLAGLIAFFLWGMLPIYWKSLIAVDPFEILCHRIIWSLVFVAIVLTCMRGWRETLEPLRSRRTLLILSLSSLMIGCNWLLYIWAVNTDHILETSLGYYINPLVNVLLGYAFLGERLKPVQIAAICLATLGVLNSVISHGALPWISLSLAVSFGFYGLLRKVAPVESLPGLFLETMVLTPLALIYLVILQLRGASGFFSLDMHIDLLLMGAGVATSLPLIGFAYGARRLRLTTVGLLQYLSPTIAFLIGIFVYHEPFTTGSLITFALIWAGLLIYTVDSMRTLRVHQRILDDCAETVSCTGD